MGFFRTRTRHRPFQVAVLITAPVCGTLLLVLDVRPASVQASMPGPIQIGWELGLIGVGVAGLLGIFWPGHLATGLGVELASLLVLGTITGMYAVALIVVSGRQGIAATSFISAVTVGSFWRGIQITGDLRRMARNGQCPSQDQCPDPETPAGGRL